MVFVRSLARPSARQSVARLARSVHIFPPHIEVAEEVRDAVLTGKPVVALESTIVTHGLPRPRNLELARDAEQIIRSVGAVPATIALVRGVPRVGVTGAELEMLCEARKDYLKVSRRDLAYCIAHGVTGGTTIAGTMILAHLAGIKVFATGGLGGVHRGAETTMDVSADLEELGRTPVAVVCAGPKAILDLPKTYEYLETKGVHVSTYGPKGTNLPAFYSRDSGIASPFNFETPADAAAVIHANNNLLRLQTGMMFCVPPPPDVEIPAAVIDVAIDQACQDAIVGDVRGKAITPFLLERIMNITEGRSVDCNIAFVKNNILVGAQIAKALSAKESWLHTSNPGSIHQTPGGVGFNLALAASYASAAAGGGPVRVVSAVGSELGAADLKAELFPPVDGDSVHNALVRSGLAALDLSGVARSDTQRTARYIAMHDAKGDLIVACGDMDIVENMDPGHIAAEFARAFAAGRVKWVGVDANLGPAALAAVLAEARRPGRDAWVLVEPTAVLKARGAVAVLGRVTEAVPGVHVHVTTPNALELAEMFAQARADGLFDRPGWWDVVGGFGDGQGFRDAVEALERSCRPHLDGLVAAGTVQQAFQLLPYIPNVFVKFGAHGVLSVQLVPAEELRFTRAGFGAGRAPRPLVTGADYIVYTSATGQWAVVVMHHRAATLDFHTRSLPADGVSHVVSVTGAGDTFAGVLLSQLVAAAGASAGAHPASALWDLDALPGVLQRAQRAAVLTIKSRFAVSPFISEIDG
ncbi:Indigoidine synthase A like protein-domain-containing protein [Dipodascopsis tothii]|uniref:Indigoidine synthase A like protein-domain-containing protein n=1 Tax=Dipodascopsis tothii TaxID=44089 RepID=UPI0034CE8069